jgi:endonuclease G, mitochondrial
MKRLIYSFLAALFTVLAPAMAHATALGDCRAQIKYGAPSHSGNLLCRLAYVLSYNTTHKTPDWVAYHLTEKQIHGNFLRTNDFRPDPELKHLNSASLRDYHRSGYIPGQMVPADDMKWNARGISESYLLSSVVPLKPAMANGIWQTLQQKIRDWVQARGELYIVAGPIYNGSPKTIGADRVAVPKACYEVVFDPVQVDAIAFIIPNRAENPQDLPKFITSVRTVEKRTGLDFLGRLNSNVKTLVASSVSPFWLH